MTTVFRGTAALVFAGGMLLGGTALCGDDDVYSRCFAFDPVYLQPVMRDLPDVGISLHGERVKTEGKVIEDSDTLEHQDRPRTLGLRLSMLERRLAELRADERNDVE